MSALLLLLLAAPTPQLVVPHGQDDIQDTAYTPDGRLVITASLGGVVRVRERRSGRQLRRFEDPDRDGVRLGRLAVSRDGRALALGAHIWAIETGQRRPGTPGARSPDGQLTAHVERGLVETFTARRRRSLRGAVDECAAMKGSKSRLPPWVAAVSNDGQVLLACKPWDTIKFLHFDARGRFVREYVDIASKGRSARFGPRGARLAIGGWVFDTKTGKKLEDMEPYLGGGPLELRPIEGGYAVLDDGYLFSGAELPTRAQRKSDRPFGPEGQVGGHMAISPDGQEIAVASSMQGILRFFDRAGHMKEAWTPPMVNVLPEFLDARHLWFHVAPKWRDEGTWQIWDLEQMRVVGEGRRGSDGEVEGVRPSDLQARLPRRVGPPPPEAPPPSGFVVEEQVQGERRSAKATVRILDEAGRERFRHEASVRDRAQVTLVPGLARAWVSLTVQTPKKRKTRELRLLDLDSKEVLARRPYGTEVAGFSRDGKKTLLRYRFPSMRVKLCDSSSGAPLAELGPYFGIVARHPSRPEVILSGTSPRPPFRKLLAAFDLGSGKRLWRKDVASAGRITAAYLGEDRVLVAENPRTRDDRRAYERAGSVELVDARRGRRRVLVARGIGEPNFTLSPDERWLIVGGRLFDLSKKRPRGVTIPGVSGARFSPDSTLLTYVSPKGGVGVARLDEGREVVRLVGRAGGEHAAVLPSGVFMASPGAAESLHYVQGLSWMTFDNLDLVYNRPHEVLEAVGLAPKWRIDAFRRAFERRVRRMGFEPEDIGASLALPEVEVLGRAALPRRVEAPKIEVKIRARAPEGSTLRSLHLEIDDVPVWGAAGRRLEGAAAEQTIEIPLAHGANLVSLSARGASGLESFRETFTVERAGPAPKRKLYFVGLGVSEYADASMNLRYAAKDARDLAAALGAFSGLELKTRLLLDAEVTRARVEALGEWLEGSAVDDVVVLFFAGHGLLDSELRYYLATHDVAFEAPEGAGLPYESFEALVDGVPARRRLVLVDACHSGELDPGAEPLPAEAVALAGGAVSGRGLKRLKRPPDAELTRELFVDLRRDAGAVVIASSSGEDLAFESEQLKNGIFSHAVQEGLRKRRADVDQDGAITTAELRRYVTEQVEALSQGRQRPTARRGTVRQDFRLE